MAANAGVIRDAYIWFGGCAAILAKSSNTFSKENGLGLLGSTVIAGVEVLLAAVVAVDVPAAGVPKLNGLLVTVDLPSSFLSLSLPNENLGVVDIAAADDDVVIVVAVVASDGDLKLNVGGVLDVVAVDVLGLIDPNVKEGVVVADEVAGFVLLSSEALAELNENVGVPDAGVVAVDTLGESAGLLNENPPSPALGAVDVEARGVVEADVVDGEPKDNTVGPGVGLVVAGISVDEDANEVGLLKLNGDEELLVEITGGTAAEDVVAAGDDPNVNDGAGIDAAGVEVVTVDFGVLKLNADAGVVALAPKLVVLLGDPNEPNDAVGAAGVIEEEWLVVLIEDPNEFAEFWVLRGAMETAGVTAGLPADALVEGKLNPDVVVDGEAEGVLKLNADAVVVGGATEVLEAPKVISEVERLRGPARSGGAINELISDACLLIVGADPKPEEVFNELKLNALFVVGAEAEAFASPNTKGWVDVEAGELAPKLKLEVAGLAGLLEEKLKPPGDAAAGLAGWLPEKLNDGEAGVSPPSLNTKFGTLASPFFALEDFLLLFYIFAVKYQSTQMFANPFTSSFTF